MFTAMNSITSLGLSFTIFYYMIHVRIFFGSWFNMAIYITKYSVVVVSVIDILMSVRSLIPSLVLRTCEVNRQLRCNTFISAAFNFWFLCLATSNISTPNIVMLSIILL